MSLKTALKYQAHSRAQFSVNTRVRSAHWFCNIYKNLLKVDDDKQSAAKCKTQTRKMCSIFKASSTKRYAKKKQSIKKKMYKKVKLANSTKN